MINLRSSLLKSIAHWRDVRRWQRTSLNAHSMRLSQLRSELARARKLRYHLDDLISVADSRLALPLLNSNAFHKAHGTDWIWRPKLWRKPLPISGMSSVQNKSKLGDEVTLFHDCEQSELTLRQLRNLREADLAPYGMRMDVFNFDGSFLSLVLDLPADAIIGLERRHLIQINTIIETEKPQKIFARLNIKHGPNTEQIVHELPLHKDEVMVEFDLAYSNLNAKRVEKAWIDLIFDNPQMSQVILRDLTCSRRLRAEI